jgi:hypothetical protein
MDGNWRLHLRGVADVSRFVGLREQASDSPYVPSVVITRDEEPVTLQ